MELVSVKDLSMQLHKRDNWDLCQAYPKKENPTYSSKLIVKWSLCSWRREGGAPPPASSWFIMHCCSQLCTKDMFHISNKHHFHVLLWSVALEWYILFIRIFHKVMLVTWAVNTEFQEPMTGYVQPFCNLTLMQSFKKSQKEESNNKKTS